MCVLATTETPTCFVDYSILHVLHQILWSRVMYLWCPIETAEKTGPTVGGHFDLGASLWVAVHTIDPHTSCCETQFIRRCGATVLEDS